MPNLTPKERAEKIADMAEHVLFSDIPDDSFVSQGVEGRRLLRQSIAAEIRAAVELEREVCASIAEHEALRYEGESGHWKIGYSEGAANVAGAIRSRGEK